MKKFLCLMMLFASMMVFTGCTGASPDADEEGVLIMKPWFFGHGGVDETPVQSGLTWCAWTTDVVYVKITPIAHDEHIEDAYSNDNTQLDFDIQIILQVEKGKSPVLIQNYGTDWYKNNIHKEFVSHFYNLVGNYSPFDLMSNRSVTDSVQVLMEQHMQNYIAKLSEKKPFPVNVNSVIIGKAKPNNDMKKEMDKTAAVIQAKKTQEQRILSEKARAEAERQRAIADKTYMAEMNLNPSQYIQLRAWDIIEKKNGANIDVLFDASADKMWNIKRN
jgi:regulator of protease activity HflC (stomatin/prohibitin superfamily)